VILTHGKSLEAPLGELHRVNAPAAVNVVQGSRQQDIARIVKETLDAMNGSSRPRDERAQKQREEIVRALTETKGRVGGVGGAAARMGINRTTLLSRMRKFGIDSGQYA
jgi:formate hydrogenlyase transcriptional activator